MASLLETKVKALVGAGFRGRLLVGKLRRETPATTDARGSPVPATPVDYPFEGIRDSFDASYAARAGIPLTDVKILIIAASLSSAAGQPKQGDLIFIRNAWHKVRRIMAIDPANATYTLQAFEVTV